MNYFSTDGVTPRMAWCAVYDPETGEVVHVHEFIGNEIADDNPHARAMRAEAAVAHAVQGRKGVKGLEVVHGDPKKPPAMGDQYAFDVKKKKLVTSRGLVSARDVAAKAPKAESTAPKSETKAAPKGDAKMPKAPKKR